MIRFKNIRFNRSVQVLAKKSEWWTTEDNAEIWLDDDDHVWIKLGGFTKLVSNVPYDAEVFQEDVPKSPSELKAAKKPTVKAAPEPAA